jgi:hypothetical protein
MKEVLVMLDPTTARTESLRNTDRWGYAGDYTEDPVPVDEVGGPSRWLVWVVLLAIAAIVIVALVGLPA